MKVASLVCCRRRSQREGSAEARAPHRTTRQLLATRTECSQAVRRRLKGIAHTSADMCVPAAASELNALAVLLKLNNCAIRGAFVLGTLSNTE